MRTDARVRLRAAFGALIAFLAVATLVSSLLLPWSRRRSRPRPLRAGWWLPAARRPGYTRTRPSGRRSGSQPPRSPCWRPATTRAAASPRRQHPHRARVSHHEFLVMFNFVVMPIPWEETPEQDRGLPDPVAGHAARVRRGIRRYRSRLRLAARGHRLASRCRPGAGTGPGAGSCS